MSYIRNAAVVEGARTNEPQGIAPTRIRVEMGDLYELETNEGALFTTVAMMAKRPGYAILQEWHTNELRPKLDVIAAAQADIPIGASPPGGTVILVDNADYFQVGMKAKHALTGEVWEVVAVDTGAGTINVTRAIGPTAAAVVLEAGDQILILGHTYGENARLRDAQSVTETHYTNDMEIKRDNFAISGTLRAVGEKGGLYHGNDVDTQRRDMMLRHKRDINLTALHGERNTGATLLDTSDRTMQGFIPFMRQFGATRFDNTGTLTEAAWNNGLRDAFRWGNSDRKTAIMSTSFAAVLDGIAKGTPLVHDTRNITPDDKMFGLRLNKWKSTHGDISMITDHALECEEWDQYCLIVDMDEKGGPKYVTLRDTFMLKDREENDLDGYEEEVLTESTFEWGNPDFHFVFDSVTG